MSEWRGLARHDDHDPDADGTAWCQRCGDISCCAEFPCLCCLLHRSEALLRGRVMSSDGYENAYFADCQSIDPVTGARCDKPAGVHRHGGFDATGTFRSWS